MWIPLNKVRLDHATQGGWFVVLADCGLVWCQPGLGWNCGPPERTEAYVLAPWNMQESLSNGALCWEDKQPPIPSAQDLHGPYPKADRPWETENSGSSVLQKPLKHSWSIFHFMEQETEAPTG